MSEEEDDIPRLPADTLTLLQEFHEEQSLQQERLMKLRTVSTDQDTASPVELNIRDIAEDWNKSQFWYDDETATTFARALLDGATKKTNIAIVSVPSVFIQLKNLLNTPAYAGMELGKLCLFEFDDRFDIFQSEFIHYDFRHPLKLSPDLKGKFDRFICDPPFLSDECHTSVALTIRWLLKPENDSTAPTQPASSSRIIVCTGRVMESLLLKLYRSLRSTNYKPVHDHGRFRNEFGTYASFECEFWSFDD